MWTGNPIVDFEPFRVQGIVQPPELDSGNGQRYSLEYLLVLLWWLGEDERRGNRVLQEVISLQDALRRLKLGVGLLMRTPDNRFGQEGIDDYLCAIMFDFYALTGFAKEFLYRGERVGATEWKASVEDKKKHWYSRILFRALKFLGGGRAKNVYCNIAPLHFTMSAWFGRHLHLYALARFVSTRKMTIWDEICIAGALWLNSRRVLKGNTDSVIFGWIYGYPMSKHSWLVYKVYHKIWRPAVIKTWGAKPLACATWSMTDHPVGFYFDKMPF